MAAVRVRVRGRVQGVGFRWYVREAAQRAGLAGFVRNLPDGDVEIAASGDDAALEDFLKAVKRGPPGARVETFERAPLADADGLARPFAIVR
jgi:acylphosphatase